MIFSHPVHYYLAAVILLVLDDGARCNWEQWWTYDGISGPTYWGAINPAWPLCARGRFQSPIDIRPDKVVFDKLLKRVNVDKTAMSGVLYNTGQSLVFKTDRNGYGGQSPPINISGGPLSYRYIFEELYLHWGDEDSTGGSEHSIDKYFFPAEAQLVAYNMDLYHNVSHASGKTHGVVAISVMIQVADGRRVNRAIRTLTQHMKKVTYNKQNFPIKSLSLGDLMPSTDGFLTYEGSFSKPGCWEGVTWILMNRPVYVGQLELTAMRSLMQGEKNNPKRPLAPNNRPVQDHNDRPIRTNVMVHPGSTGSYIYRGMSTEKCPEVANEVEYSANAWSDVKVASN